MLIHRICMLSSQMFNLLCWCSSLIWYVAFAIQYHLTSVWNNINRKTGIEWYGMVSYCIIWYVCTSSIHRTAKTKHINKSQSRYIYIYIIYVTISPFEHTCGCHEFSNKPNHLSALPMAACSLLDIWIKWAPPAAARKFPNIWIVWAPSVAATKFPIMKGGTP
jgi:hypothetical protein